MPELQFRAYAGHSASADRCVGTEVATRIQATPGLRQLLPAVAVVVEGQRVDVDVAGPVVAEDEPCRQARLDLGRVLEAEPFEPPPRRGQVRPVDGEVEVGVLAGLVPQ
jgi:hypothetical protein